jgi:hypothetical protein
MKLKIALAAAVFTLSTSALARPQMTGFAQVAATGDEEQLRGVGWGRSGRFTLAVSGATGTFRRNAETTSIFNRKSYEGTVDFTVSGPGIDGELSGSCGYGQRTIEAGVRTGRRSRLGVEAITDPFAYSCLFSRDGQPVGQLELMREQGRPVDIRTMRRGFVETDHTALDLRSVHTFAGSRMPAEMPLGYLMARAEDKRPAADVGAAYLNGNARRLVLPRDPKEREAVLLASLALAFLWDPGDGD